MAIHEYGKTFSGWAAFAAHLRKIGVDPYTWATNHPQKAVAYGAPFAITHLPKGPSGPVHTTTPGAFGGVVGGGGNPLFSQFDQPIVGPGGRPVRLPPGRGNQPGGGGPGGGEQGEYPGDDGGFFGEEGASIDIPGGDGGGGAGPASPPLPAYTDYSQLLGIAGLPPEVAAQLNNIFRQYPDPSAAAAVALGYIRSTPWYAQTFVGINTGIQRGLFSDESGYRDYRNAINQVYQQWQGRAASEMELTSALNEGVDPGTVNRRFEADALVKAISPEARYLLGAFGEQRNPLSQDQMNEMIGDAAKNQVGLGTVGGTGAIAERALERARAIMQRAFSGQAASPQLALTGAGRLFSPSLTTDRTRPDLPTS